MKKIHLICLSFALLTVMFAPKIANAQLQVAAMTTHPTWNADSLVRNIMLGEGVEIFNVKLNNSLGVIGGQTGVGVFTTGNTQTNLGLQSGIVLSASAMSYLTNTNGTGTNNSSMTDDVTPNSGDPDLRNIVNDDVNNCMVLEFDFIPRADSVKFRYVFASEEYYGYECTDYNDIFAFFLDGVRPPSLGGGLYTKKNIALVPNTETPITINTVNGGTAHGNRTPCILTNTQYFVSNSSQQFLKNMDGFTTVLTAEAAVIPCQTYHLKMAVANVGDQLLPSAVFLEANSLTSNAIEYEFVNAANPGHLDELYEGCMATVTLSRPQVKYTDTQVQIEYSGTASNGGDFPQINPILAFPAGQNSITLSLQPYMDGETEGIETAKLVFSASDGCERADSVEFHIIDTEPLRAFINHDTIDSRTSSVWIYDSIIGGMPNRTARWFPLDDPSNVRIGDRIQVNVTTDKRWVLEVTDSCMNIGMDTILVGRRNNFAQILRDTFGTTPYLSRLRLSDTTICDEEPLNLFVHGADSCVWYTSLDSNPFNMRDTIVSVEPHQLTRYYVRSYLWWNGQYWEDIDSVLVQVVPLPEVSLSASLERVCIGKPVTLTGTGTPNFSWDGGVTFGTNSTLTVTPDTTTMYHLYGQTNGAECYGHDSVLVIVDTMPIIDLGDGTGVCGGEQAELTVTTVAENFTWSAQPPDATLTGQETRSHIFVNPSVTTVYTVTANTGVCYNTNSTTVAVEPNPVAIGEVTPTTVSLGNMEATFIDLSQHSTTRVWELPYGEQRTDKQITYVVPDDVDSVTVRLWAYNPYQCFDTTTITVYVDHTTMWIPNAFTPEESTNQTFEVKMNDIQRYHILIYDRRGQLVFESYNPDMPWTGVAQNGKKCPQGVYTYLISCHKITHPYEQLVYRGTVLLIR